MMTTNRARTRWIAVAAIAAALSPIAYAAAAESGLVGGPGNESDAPIPVEPNGGIGDTPIPVEPNGGIGDTPTPVGA